MNRRGLISRPTFPMCVAQLFKQAFDGHDLGPLRAQCISRVQSNPADAAALMDLCVIEQLLGRQSSGLMYHTAALKLQRLYRSSWPTSQDSLHVLMFMAPGDIGNNTPIEFLLERSDVVLHSLYVVPGEPLPMEFPDHDIAIAGPCASDQNLPILQEIERVMANWPCPVLNHPRKILDLSREKMHAVLQPVQELVIPKTIRIDRDGLQAIATGRLPVREAAEAPVFPLIARPVDTHAGRGLAKLDNPEAISVYLSGQTDREFHVSRFMNYRSSDGFYRKYRIIWVDGRPYPCHMAITDDWKIWYYNAGMAASEAKRREEELFFNTFHGSFARRHAVALAAIPRLINLEYFGIDCAELPDGRLLVFEGDNTLVAHDMDSPDLYPYKSDHMQKLFGAFRDMMKGKSIARLVAQ